MGSNPVDGFVGLGSHDVYVNVGLQNEGNDNKPAHYVHGDEPTSAIRVLSR